MSKRYGKVDLRSFTEPASAATAAWARCADKDSWVSSTIIRAIVGGIELRINVGTTTGSKSEGDPGPNDWFSGLGWFTV